MRIDIFERSEPPAKGSPLTRYLVAGFAAVVYVILVSFTVKGLLESHSDCTSLVWTVVLSNLCYTGLVFVFAAVAFAFFTQAPWLSRTLLATAAGTAGLVIALAAVLIQRNLVDMVSCHDLDAVASCALVVNIIYSAWVLMSHWFNKI